MFLWLCIGISGHHKQDILTKTYFQIIPITMMEMDPFCIEHNEKFTLFCRSHESPCCKTCSLEKHKQCQDVSKIEEVFQNVKASNSFLETEQILNALAGNIQKLKNHREDNLELLQQSKMQVEREINEYREKVNDHLDKIQVEIIKELNKAEETEKTKIQKIVNDLEQHKKIIDDMQVNFSKIKQEASDLQAYLAMKKIQNDVDETVSVVDSLVNSDKLQQKILSFEIDTAITDIPSCVKSFGNIVTAAPKDGEDHGHLQIPQPRAIDDITLELQQTLNVNVSNINGCCILPDGRLVFTYYRCKHLILMKADGTEHTTLDLPSFGCDVTYVKHNNTLAVSSGFIFKGPGCITFINLQSNKVVETFDLQSHNYGIAEKDDTLYICECDTINVLNLNDKTITKFKHIEPNIHSYIDIFENNLYHTNFEENTITCNDLGGEVKWEFKDESLIKGPYGISVDNQGDVYVAGKETSNVVVISPDGQKCRELLSTQDNMSEPWALHYNRSTDNLLVANKMNTAFLYKIT